jgi:hypothetical protein
MTFPIVRVVFYSEKMLGTIDLSVLLKALFRRFGYLVRIEFSMMSEQEKFGNTQIIDGISVVRCRVEIYEIDGIEQRRQDEIESEIINLGCK